MSKSPLTDADGKVAFMVGFATYTVSRAWKMMEPQYSLGHEIIWTRPTQIKYADLLDLVNAKLLGNQGLNTVNINNNLDILCANSLVVNWGLRHDKGLRQTIITTENLASTLLLMTRRGVDVIGAVCEPRGCELSLPTSMRFRG